jgi:hypothetical protein
VTDRADVDRDTLITELAHTAHQTTIRQAARDRDVPIEEFGNIPTDDDRECAAAIVVTLERLGLYARAPLSPRFGFLRHPLVVGGAVAAISAVLASLLIPSFTRVASDRPKELELKRGIVGRIATSSTETLARGVPLAKNDFAAAGGAAGDKKQTTFRKLRVTWLANAGAINAELLTYLPSVQPDWQDFQDAVSSYLLLAGITDPEVRQGATSSLHGYLGRRPFPSSRFERRYKVVPWADIRSGKADTKHWIESIQNLLLERRDRVMVEVADGQARGFKHSVWSLD